MRCLAIILTLSLASAACADETAIFTHPNVLDAHYADPTTRYGHDALGAGHEWGALVLELDMCPACNLLTRETRTLVLSEDLVFEDLAPRLTDLDRDGRAEVLVVESSQTKGARLALWGPQGRVAAGDFIGQRHRWLAMVGVDDFDGDGTLEVAYVETPHLGKTLKIAQLNGDRLDVIAEAKGLTNHHFGADIIESAIVSCSGLAVIVTANADWTKVMATRFDGGKLTSQPFADYDGPSSFENLPLCE